MPELSEQERKMLEKIPAIETKVELISQKQDLQYKRMEEIISPLVETVKKHDKEIEVIKTNQQNQKEEKINWRYPFWIAVVVLVGSFIVQLIANFLF